MPQDLQVDPSPHPASSVEYTSDEGAQYPELVRLSAEERALIARLREVRAVPKPWLIELLAWAVEVQASAVGRQPRQWLLKFTGGLSWPERGEFIPRGK